MGLAVRVASIGLSFAWVLVTGFLSVAAQDHWTLKSADLMGVAHGNGRFVAAGDYGTVLMSADGIHWAPQASGTDVHLQGAAFGQGLFVVVGEIGRIRTSTDGGVWESQSSGTTADLMAVAHGNGSFVAVGKGGSVLTSVDGTQWIPRSPGLTANLSGLTHARDAFVAVGDGGVIAVSRDGITWTTPPSTVGFGAGSFLAVGESGTILSSVYEPVAGVELVLPTSLSTGGFQFTVSGHAPSPVRIQASGDLRSWITLTNLDPAILPARVVDSMGQGPAARFYRGILP